MELIIRNQQDKVIVTPETEELLNTLVCAVIREENLDMDPEVSILLVDDAEIQELNRSYRGMDRPTDVLSFAMNEEMEGAPEFISLEESNLLGDIVISLETAGRQAEEYGHSLERELGFLTVHGMLHLLGYDHGNEAETAEMRQKEEKILNQVGLER
ncbi:rRNA maturation RNase YbeY [Candidatus Formimonas warabiya]|uniref:rRNA maturation RNase YbeY n=1 Tax=Formimonas warabiya TaxID=1761012 RepID=UPI0011D03C2C|nr:rRNA maturation RNase YbeY [Candidatus Formimonas warabiya]